MKLNTSWIRIGAAGLCLGSGGCVGPGDRTAVPDGGNPVGSLRFAVLGDYQFMHDESFAAVLDDVNAARPAFSVQCGDLVLIRESYEVSELDRQWAAFRAMAARLSAPLYPVPGNHDVQGPRTAAAWNGVWGALYYSFTRGAALFVVLNTEAGIVAAQDGTGAKRKPAPGVAGALGEEQIQWLREELDRADSRHVFVFMHKPLWRIDREGWTPFHDLFVRKRVRAVFAGHTHVFGHARRDAIDYLIATSSEDRWHWRGGARFEAGRFAHAFGVDVDGDDIRIRILHRGQTLPLSAVDPIVQRAHRIRWIDAPPPLLLSPQPVPYAPVFSNSTTRPVAIEYAWRETGSWTIAPQRGTAALAPDASQTATFEMRPVSPDALSRPVVAPQLGLDIRIETDDGRTRRLSTRVDIPFAVDFSALTLADTLPGRVVLIGAGRGRPLPWLLEAYGLQADNEFFVAHSPEDLDRMLPWLQAGDTLVPAHFLLAEQPEFAAWFESQWERLRVFIEAGGRFIGCLGHDNASDALLDRFGIAYRRQTPVWRTVDKGSNARLYWVEPLESNALAAGLVGNLIRFDKVALSDGWYEPKPPSDYRTLAADSVGGALIVARQMGKGLVVLAAARLNSNHEIRDNWNQQRVWANLLTLSMRDAQPQ